MERGPPALPSAWAPLLPSTPPSPGPASPSEQPTRAGGVWAVPCPSPAGPQPGLLSPVPTGPLPPPKPARDHRPYADP